MGRPMATSQDFVNWVCGPELDPHFLMYVLLANRRHIRELGSGAVHQTVYFPTVESFCICAPGVPEQRRIASQLAEQLEAATTVVAAAKERLSGAEALPGAYLASVFEGKEARSWPSHQIGAVSRVKTGYAFKSSWFVPDGPVRVLRNANVHQGVIEWLDTVAMDEPSLARFKDFSLREGDIVLSLDRPIVANGLKVATVSLSDTPSLLNQRVGRFDIDTANVVPGFLYGFLRSPQFARALKGHDQSLGVPHVSPGQVERVEMPVPPLDVQTRLVARLSEALRSAEVLIASSREEVAMTESIAKSLLRHCFSEAPCP